MVKRYSLLILICGFLLAFTTSCEKHYASETPDEEQSDDENGTDGSEDSNDYIWSGTEIVYITLNSTTITVNGNGATASGSTVTITSEGTYSISGNLTNGQVIVDTNDDGIVRLILNGVSITSSSSSPIYVKDAVKVVIILADNTTNCLTDGTSYVFDDTENQEPDATIFSKSYISFYGTGSLVVKGNYNDGINGKDGMVIKSGTISVTSKDDGIRGKDYLIIRDGKITVTSTGNGLKSDNDTDTSLGYITIDKGVFSITSGGDAMTAQTDINITYAEMTILTGGGSGNSSSGYTGLVSAKAIKAASDVTITDGIFSINSADDALHATSNINVNGGTFTIATSDDAIHGDAAITLNGGNISITKCYEGVESPSINVQSGYISIVSSDDSFNATQGTRTEQNDGSLLNITGGTIVANTSSGDGLDSNGSISMSGGTVVSYGPSSQPNVAMDYNGTFNISGGLLIGAGPNSGNMIQSTSTSSGQYCVKTTISSTLSSSTFFHIQDSDGKDLVTFKPVRTAYYIVFSSSSLVNGSTYYIYTGGSYDLTSTNGLYTGGTYSGGTLKKSFTVTGKVTTVSI